jgi:hypothetical protein
MREGALELRQQIHLYMRSDTYCPLFFVKARKFFEGKNEITEQTVLDLLQAAWVPHWTEKIKIPATKNV